MNLARVLVVTFIAGIRKRGRRAGTPRRPAADTQEPASPFEHVVFGVGFEGFYQYNWNKPYDRINLLRAYDTRANVFGIQQATSSSRARPKVDAGRRFGARVDLQFGQATETVQGGAANEPRPDVYRHIWQAYGTYVFPVGRGLQTDFGKFASKLGYETNYAKDNNHFSRAYLFNFLPFYHSGLRVSLPVNDKVTVMYMLTNGIQQTEDFNNFKSNHFAAIVKPAAKRDVDDQLLLRPGTAGRRRAGRARRLLPGVRHLRRLHGDAETRASASTSTTSPTK